MPLVTSPRLHACIVAAILFQIDGIEELHNAIAEAETDWRDLLVAVGLANSDWPTVITAQGINIDKLAGAMITP